MNTILNWISIRLFIGQFIGFIYLSERGGRDGGEEERGKKKRKKKRLSPNQFPSYRMRKISSISIYTCAVIVKVMIAISPCHLNNMKPHIINDLGNLLVFFILIYLIWMTDKNFSIIALANVDSWVITEYHFQPIVHVMIVFQPT